MFDRIIRLLKDANALALAGLVIGVPAVFLVLLQLRDHGQPNRSVSTAEPAILPDSWRIETFEVGKRHSWVMTFVNAGRPVVASVTSYQSLIDRGPIPRVSPTCEDTKTYGAANPYGARTNARFSGSDPLTQAQFDEANSGVPYVASGTLCYRDDVLGLHHVTRFCVLRTSDGNVQQCRKGNEIE